MQINIVELLKECGLAPQKVAGTWGGEFLSPCPACGGEDRFRCWPNHEIFALKGGSYWCRQCNAKGDAIQFLRDYRDMTYQEACQYIGLTPGRSLRKQPQLRGLQKWQPNAQNSPDDAWQRSAQPFVYTAHQQLPEAVSAKFQQRGLSADTINKYQLGYNPANKFLDQTQWGFSEEYTPQLNIKKLWIPKGMVIPYVRENQIRKIWIRRVDHGQPGDNLPKYVLVKGSSTCTSVYGDDSNQNKPVMVVESEMDAMLINQEAGDLVVTMALGSTRTKPDVYAHSLLLKTPLILVALDCDEPGHIAAEWWPTIYHNSKRVVTPEGKDPSEYYQLGGSVREWVQACLPRQLIVHGLIDTEAGSTGDYCLGVSCPYAIAASQNGCSGLTCRYQDSTLVLYMATCPLGHWVKPQDQQHKTTCRGELDA